MMIKSIRMLLLLAVFSFSFSYLYAQDTLKLNLDKAIMTALENNVDTKIAQLEVKQAQAAVDQAFGNVYPSVNFSANYSRFLEKSKMPFPDFEALLTNTTYDLLFEEGVLPYDESKFLPMQTKLQAFAQTNNYEAKIEATQIIFNSAVFTGIGASEQYYNTSKEMLNSKVAETILNVKKAFYGVLLSQEVLNITKASFDNARDNFSNVSALYEQGLVSEFDKLQAEVQVENIRPNLLMVENNLNNAKDGLKMVMGIAPETPINIEGIIEYKDENIPEYDKALNKALESNFDLRTLKLKKEVDEAFVDLDNSGYWPSLIAFANYSFAGSADDFEFQNYRSSMVGLSLNINLFNGFQTTNKVQQSKIDVMKTEEQIGQLQDYLNTQIRLKLLDIQRIKSNIEAQERNINVAERAYELAKVRYKEGTGSQLEIQNSDIALRQARTNRLQSVYEFIVAQSEIDKLTGNIDREYLEPFMDKKFK
jgi:outer membrane protein